MFDLEEIALLRMDYQPGTRITLVHSDWPDLPRDGMIGVVQEINELGAVRVKWRDGSVKVIVPWKDRIEKRPFLVQDMGEYRKWGNVEAAKIYYKEKMRRANQHELARLEKILKDIDLNLDICAA